MVQELADLGYLASEGLGASLFLSLSLNRPLFLEGDLRPVAAGEEGRREKPRRGHLGNPVSRDRMATSRPRQFLANNGGGPARTTFGKKEPGSRLCQGNADTSHGYLDASVLFGGIRDASSGQMPPGAPFRSRSSISATPSSAAPMG